MPDSRRTSSLLIFRIMKTELHARRKQIDEDLLSLGTARQFGLAENSDEAKPSMC